MKVIDYRFEATPLIVGGMMYVSTPAAPQSTEPQGDDHRARSRNR